MKQMRMTSSDKDEHLQQSVFFYGTARCKKATQDNLLQHEAKLQRAPQSGVAFSDKHFLHLRLHQFGS